MQKRRLRIAHISDLHWRCHLHGTSQVPSRRSREMPALFENAIGAIARQQPDLLVLSGDLLDYPLECLDDPGTHEQGEQDLRQIASILEALECPKAIVHGNHDHPLLVQKVFGHFPDDFVCCGHRVVIFRDDEVHDHVPERTGPQRERFNEVTSDPDSLVQIHVQHYLVWPEKNQGYPHTYRDGQDLRDALIRSGRVQLCLSGHYHAGIELFQECGVFFAAAPAFCEPPHPYWIYELSGLDSPGVWRL